MPLSSGQLLNNRYRLDAPIGQGGFGAVYRAWDINLDKPVAIKENLELSPLAQKQFTQEAKILSNLSHPHLPRVTDHFFLPNQGQYLVMDFVDGEDLQSMVTRCGPLPEAQVLAWLGQTCDALAYMHSQNPPIIHRDLKPANIKIRPDGRAMLVDFGIAKVYDANLPTTMGAKAVTPGYSPPEQYGYTGTDGRSDIYALGATLYTLLTGQLPPESVQRMVGAAELPSLRQVNPHLSPALEQTVLKALEVDTRRRFQCIAELQAALLALADLRSPRPFRLEPLSAAEVQPPAGPSAPKLASPPPAPGLAEWCIAAFLPALFAGGAAASLRLVTPLVAVPPEPGLLGLLLVVYLGPLVLLGWVIAWLLQLLLGRPVARRVATAALSAMLLAGGLTLLLFVFPQADRARFKTSADFYLTLLPFVSLLFILTAMTLARGQIGSPADRITMSEGLATALISFGLTNLAAISWYAVISRLPMPDSLFDRLISVVLVLLVGLLPALLLGWLLGGLLRLILGATLIHQSRVWLYGGPLLGWLVPVWLLIPPGRLSGALHGQPLASLVSLPVVLLALFMALMAGATIRVADR